MPVQSVDNEPKNGKCNKLRLLKHQQLSSPMFVLRQMSSSVSLDSTEALSRQNSGNTDEGKAEPSAPFEKSELDPTEMEVTPNPPRLSSERRASFASAILSRARSAKLTSSASQDPNFDSPEPSPVSPEPHGELTRHFTTSRDSTDEMDGDDVGSYARDEHVRFGLEEIERYHQRRLQAQAHAQGQGGSGQYVLNAAGEYVRKTSLPEYLGRGESYCYEDGDLDERQVNLIPTQEQVRENKSPWSRLFLYFMGLPPKDVRSKYMV